MSEDVGGPPLTLRWHEFSRNIGATSALFRTEKTFSDVTLIVENMKVEAHKFILGSCSSLFLEMLQYSQHPHPLVYLRGVQHKQLLSLLDFMYHGETRVEQDDLPTFLKTAEDLQVKGLTERQEVEKDLPSPCQSPVQRLEFPQNHIDKEREEYSSKEITPMAIDETNRYKLPDTEVEEVVQVTTSSKSSKRNRQENLEMRTNKLKKGNGKDLDLERRKEYEPTVRKIIDELIPNVTERERKVSGLFKSAITAAEGEIEALKNQMQPEERHKEVEDVSTTITDATDDTISEVERILQETKKILGEERDNDVCDVSDGNISSSGSETLPSESSRPLPERRKSRFKKPPLNTVMRERQLMKFVEKTKTPMQIPGNIPLPEVVSPDQVAESDNVVKKASANASVSSELAVEPEFPITPEKPFQPSEKDKQVIACLVVKLTGVQGWRCTMCRQTFLSKSETEKHVGINHVLGNLN